MSHRHSGLRFSANKRPPIFPARQSRSSRQRHFTVYWPFSLGFKALDHDTESWDIRCPPVCPCHVTHALIFRPSCPPNHWPPDVSASAPRDRHARRRHTRHIRGNSTRPASHGAYTCGLYTGHVCLVRSRACLLETAARHLQTRPAAGRRYTCVCVCVCVCACVVLFVCGWQAIDVPREQV